MSTGLVLLFCIIWFASKDASPGEVRETILSYALIGGIALVILAIGYIAMLA